MRLERAGWAWGWVDFATFVRCSEVMKPISGINQPLSQEYLIKPIKAPKPTMATSPTNKTADEASEYSGKIQPTPGPSGGVNS
jgi:hypothetical protein